MKRFIGWVVLIAVTAGIAGTVYYYWQKSQIQERQGPAIVRLTAPQTRSIPQIRHPIGTAETEGRESGAAKEQLPPLRESDTALRSALTALFSANTVEKFFYLKNIAYHMVATIDNLARRQGSQRLMPLKPPPGRFLTTREGKTVFIDPNNYRRYTPYVRLVESVNAKRLVTVYVHFYPLFQRAYEDLGYPKSYFNDRLIEAIDNLLATPDVRGPIKLIRPNVLYEFANPALQGLSVGQKILVRMGNSNAAKVKAKLREIRRLLTLDAGQTHPHK
ncbi:MAG: DUF3014 domain-containing protein [Acidiferrobacteraceae bacterium]